MTQKRYNERFIARVNINGLRLNAGTFDTKERALIAEKLAKYWSRKGFDIPLQPKTIDAL